MLREIVLSGGGTNGLALVGCLHGLYERGWLQHVRRWVGASSGALIATFLALGYTPQCLYQLLLRIDFASLNELSCDNIMAFYDTMGVMDATGIMAIMRAALHKKGFGAEVTFCELRKGLAQTTHKDVVITGYNLTRGDTEAFSADTTPYMSVLLALRISISVPFLFRPVVHNNDMYIDGCSIEHVPVRFAQYKRRSLVIDCKSKPPAADTTTTPNEDRLPPAAPLPTDVMGFFALFRKRVFGILEDKCTATFRKRHPERLLVVYVPPAPNGRFVVNFTMDDAQKERLFLAGHEAVLKHQRFGRAPHVECSGSHAQKKPNGH